MGTIGFYLVLFARIRGLVSRYGILIPPPPKPPPPLAALAVAVVAAAVAVVPEEVLG